MKMILKSLLVLTGISAIASQASAAYQYDIYPGQDLWFGRTRVVCHEFPDTPVAQILRSCTCEVPALGGALKVLVQSTTVYYDSTRVNPRTTRANLGTYDAGTCQDLVMTSPSCR